MTKVSCFLNLNVKTNLCDRKYNKDNSGSQIFLQSNYFLGFEKTDITILPSSIEIWF